MLSQIDRGKFTQPQQKEMAVLNLPVDVITRMICSFLTVQETARARSVSKQFRMLMEQAIECYTDIFESSNVDMQSTFARALVRRMRNVRHIKLYNSSQTIIHDLAIRVGAKLRVLECINCSMSDLALANIARACLGLEVIRVTMRSNGEMSRISDVSLAFIARKAACADFLREVSIQGCPKVTDLGLAYLLYHCPRLKVVKASECGVSNVLQLPASMLSLNSNERNVAVKLDMLDLSSNHELTPGALLSIPHIGSLRSLRISGAVRITDAALQQIAQECFNLEELSIANCSQITDQGLEAFASTGAAMRLEHLDVARCSRIADTGLNAIVKFGNLRTLDAQGCFRVSDYFLRVAGMYGRNLESINLKGLASLTDAGVDALAKGCPKLKDLCLGSCHALGDETLYSLSVNCPNLEKLDLFCVHHVTDDGMMKLVKGCPNMTSINLSYCFRVSGDFIKRCKNKKYWKGLKELAITGLQDSIHVASSASNNKSKSDEFEIKSGKKPFNNTSPKLGSSLLNTSPKLGSSGFAVDLSAIDSPERKRDNNNRRRSGSLQRQDSSSSLVLKKTPVPGVHLDVTGSPRAKLQALMNRDQMSVLNLSDGMSSPSAGLSSASLNGTRYFGDSPKDLEREKVFQAMEEELEREKKNRNRG